MACPFCKVRFGKPTPHAPRAPSADAHGVVEYSSPTHGVAGSIRIAERNSRRLSRSDGGGLRSFLARGSVQDARLIRIAPDRRVSFGAAGRLGLAGIQQLVQ